MLELTDVVLVLGPTGDERVLLRGADLVVPDGERVLLSGLDAEARQGLAALLSGRVAPRYGRVTVDGTDVRRAGVRVTVLDLGEGPDAPMGHPPPHRSPTVPVVGLGGPSWSGRPPPGYRSVLLRGGQLLEAAPSAPAPRASARTLPLGELRTLAQDTLSGAGVPARAAAVVARMLVDAERRGHRSHGVALLPTYLRRIQAGGIDPRAVPQLTTIATTVARVDARGGLGQLAADAAARWCASTAAAHGLASVAVHDNNHVGMMAVYRWPFQEHGVVGLLLNTSGPSVAAPGARRPTLGSNAICLVTPTHDAEPFCVDLATGVVAAGKIRDAANRGVAVPPGWLQDAGGEPSTDPYDLDRGGSVPVFGGYKGLCTSLLVEVLAGALAGGRVSPDVAKQRAQPAQVMGCSQLFVGFSPAHLGGGGIDLSLFVQRLRSAVLAGHDGPPARPWFPDQLEEDHAADVEAHGVSVPPAVLAELGWGPA
jgi:LDH2 family malate/lactate/ureidoglycolate dehydrogenase